MLLGARRHDLGLDGKLRQHLRQPVHPLAERVEQRQPDRRLRDLERHARKARAAADVDHALAAEVRRAQQRDAVEKVQLCHGRRLGDGGQVHDLVFFDQRLPEAAERIDLRLGERGGRCRKAGKKRLFHGAASKFQNKREAEASRLLYRI